MSLEYNKSKDGEILANKDNDRKVRELVRRKNIDHLSNNGFNIMNGSARFTIEVPQHPVYNPPTP